MSETPVPVKVPPVDTPDSSKPPLVRIIGDLKSINTVDYDEDQEHAGVIGITRRFPKNIQVIYCIHIPKGKIEIVMQYFGSPVVVTAQKYQETSTYRLIDIEPLADYEADRRDAIGDDATQPEPVPKEQMPFPEI